MKILIVEDSKNRIRKFYTLLGHHEIVAVNYTEGAVELLKSHSFDLFFLDYDLREGQTKNDYLSAYWANNEREMHYAQHNYHKPVVVIHSLNTPGAEKMESQLKTIGVISYRINYFDIIRNELSLLSQQIKLNL